MDDGTPVERRIALDRVPLAARSSGHVENRDVWQLHAVPDQPMNIGILIPGFSDGEQDWCIPVYLNLVRALAQSNSVRVFALRYPPRRDTYSVYNAQVYALGGGSSTAGVARWILLARTVVTIIRQHRVRPFDILH